MTERFKDVPTVFILRIVFLISGAVGGAASVAVMICNLLVGLFGCRVGAPSKNGDNCMGGRESVIPEFTSAGNDQDSSSGSVTPGFTDAGNN